jgi:hypothetical protein
MVAARIIGQVRFILLLQSRQQLREFLGKENHGEYDARR